jgi:hypothetical protein
MTDYKQLCAELLSELTNAIGVIYGEDGTRHISSADPVIAKADAALAEPEPEGPTDEELESFLVDVACQNGDMYYADPRVLARAVLARWGNHPGSLDSSTQSH